jgi:hypothetical protein
MAHQITKKHDFEKAKLRDKAPAQDYIEKLHEEAPYRDPGGKDDLTR